MNDEPIRFTDVLTTASAVANYLGAREVTAQHLVEAVDLVTGKKGMEELGRPVSPLVPRPGGQGTAAATVVRELAVRWYARLGSDPMAVLSAADLVTLREECVRLAEDAE